MAGLADILYAIQNAVTAIQKVGTTLVSVDTTLGNTFLQSGTVNSTGSSATLAANSTLAFTSSQAAGFFSVTSASGVSFYIPLYR